MVGAKHELEIAIENMQREVQSRHMELESMKQVKEKEITNLKKTHDRQLRERQEEES